jgi:flagellar hook-basal body complex protein FliE
MSVSKAQLLQQIRDLSALAKGEQTPKVELGNQFGNVLKTALHEVNNAQMQSGDLKNSFELGDPNVSLAQVMVASQKAEIGFQAVLQIRNKVVDAYKEIMNMAM